MGTLEGRDPFNILIAGEAGQGLATMGDLLTKALVRSGYRVVVRQGYMSRIRGGHNTYQILASTGAIHAPREPVDLLVGLNEASVELHRGDLSDGGLIVAEDDNEALAEEDLGVPLAEMAEGLFINIAALGAICCMLGLSRDTVAGLVRDQFGKKDEEIAELNDDALAAGYEWIEEHDRFDAAFLPLADEPSETPMTLNGNEAIALGALSAGLKFYSFYPMTPATSIGLNIIKHADEMGVVYEQAEDEISAINMAIGASFTGAPAMVATSGGGFALMCEGLSLAGMTETPVVIAIAQRPGPATGLPTRTAQQDLEFVLHGGHGEFPRAIFAPGTIEQCFHLARQAFMIAEKTHSPAFILTDQYLADSSRAVQLFDVENLPPVDVPLDAGPAAEPYRRYEITESGVSPRLLPGVTEHLV
ncbi:MAG: 2-oxoacid:acceptor oxidoreductase subunit alpha, partial [Armatimonadota bacterium]